MNRGKFITLEGGEGVGKSTNLDFIRRSLERQGMSVVVTREPGGTELAEKIRQLLLDNNTESITPTAELLMMFAARSQHIAHVIEPALQQGRWVLCDRFTDATFAYQGGGRGMDLQVIEWLERCVQGDLRPDLTLLLDAPVEIGLRRVRQRGDFDRFEQEKSDFFERVRQSYLRQAQLYPSRFEVIDASQALDQVQQAVAVALSALI
ncbi:dTMP kinase [Methylomarinum sp. Ch1-1]|uniref:Thymidylate kinase n=1 Tax=Methylomarinum roseum TaxID=3067653 RepID=A0AAU7NSS7_9GAMM|nr:dTMP kinase [Methylomarinum sp. Ch1-1]MDP4519958.1 dTMP kinase [Methylomarinum sp. Ch1-1]